MANKTVADVMKLVKDNEVKFVDFRFTDTRGKEQHAGGQRDQFIRARLDEHDGDRRAGEPHQRPLQRQHA